MWRFSKMCCHLSSRIIAQIPLKIRCDLSRFIAHCRQEEKNTMHFIASMRRFHYSDCALRSSQRMVKNQDEITVKQELPDPSLSTEQFSAVLPSQQPSTSERAPLSSRPSFSYFMTKEKLKTVPDLSDEADESYIPYLSTADIGGNNRKVFFETYGCQMNENDTEIAWSILKKNGFQLADNIERSDVILVMTCAIREGAEDKIWKRLQYLKSLKIRRERNKQLPSLKIGILGCMAERLKTKIVDREKMVDIVCGPDAYKDLPRMLADTELGQVSVNVLLSLDETYADVMPVRLNNNSPSAFVSIQRGCDNMCTYCIVPFTRGRERSRPIESIVDEIKQLSDQGVKEVMLLGQNVNSYRDTSVANFRGSTPPNSDLGSTMSKGFRTVYRSRTGGFTFADLLDRVSLVDPEMRIRFTSPHPKDFPDDVLRLVRDRPNICRQVHLPAQSGSTRILELMRRGYSADAYAELVEHVRDIVPDVSLSSDFIVGFCGETDADHRQTIDLVKRVKYDAVFCYPYSVRQKTAAFHRLRDDVPNDVKNRRQEELVAVVGELSKQRKRSMIGKFHVVMIEGDSKRSSTAVVGRNDGNTKVIIPKVDIPTSRESQTLRQMNVGDYVVVKIDDASSLTLKGTALHHIRLQDIP